MAEGQEDIIILNGRWKMEELDLSTNTKMGSPDGKSDNNLKVMDLQRWFLDRNVTDADALHYANNLVAKKITTVERFAKYINKHGSVQMRNKGSGIGADTRRAIYVTMLRLTTHNTAVKPRSELNSPLNQSLAALLEARGAFPHICILTSSFKSVYTGK